MTAPQPRSLRPDMSSVSSTSSSVCAVKKPTVPKCYFSALAFGLLDQKDRNRALGNFPLFALAPMTLDFELMRTLDSGQSLSRTFFTRRHVGRLLVAGRSTVSATPLPFAPGALSHRNGTSPALASGDAESFAWGGGGFGAAEGTCPIVAAAGPEQCI